MEKDPRQIRLPELPVFKKYSLALRQEFAGADEVLSMLERTKTRVGALVERAEEQRRRQEAAGREIAGSPVEAPRPRAPRRKARPEVIPVSKRGDPILARGRGTPRKSARKGGAAAKRGAARKPSARKRS